ncbi:hypothetical protein Btru_074616 [Bulinus truncatus]|nr:hypothetical protein Btru_074616 [Bulinus truncatus]
MKSLTAQYRLVIVYTVGLNDHFSPQTDGQTSCMQQLHGNHHITHASFLSATLYRRHGVDITTASSKYADVMVLSRPASNSVCSHDVDITTC